jgi:integrase
MAAIELMGWQKSQHIWQKRYRGRLYAVSPRQLGIDPTKEASRVKANEWWEKKKDEIDTALGKARQHPAYIVEAYQTAIEKHRLFAKWNRKYGMASLAEAERHNAEIDALEAEVQIEWLTEALQSDDPPYPLSDKQQDPLWQLDRRRYPALNDGVPEIVAASRWRERLLQIRREERAETSTTPPENTIRSHIDHYLELRKAQAQAQNKMNSFFYSTKPWLSVFRNWADPYDPIEAINEQLWERFFVFLSGKVANANYSASTMKDYQGSARSFIKWAWERGHLKDLPRNLTSRNLVVRIPLTEPVLFTVDEIQMILATANETQKLYALLALNCGMYPKDISSLRQDEVDWEAGRIKRQRTKTRERSNNVPKVDYPLWRTTFALLAKHRSKHKELALTNEQGGALWVQADNKAKSSAVEMSWKRLMVKVKLSDNVQWHPTKNRELTPDDVLAESTRKYWWVCSNGHEWEAKGGTECPICSENKEEQTTADRQRKPLKSLRKTGASMLENSQYGRFSEHYLGEAPKTIASRHYAHKNGSEFDESIIWLGKQLSIK